MTKDKTPPVTEWFSHQLLNWFDQHGRKHLPWQINPTSYRVWVSEIMLQQTQVSTVIDYYQRFMQRFPDLTSLAEATQDEVLQQWSGLGYYARGRNLHRAAQLICTDHQGNFPEVIEAVIALPGIGRSTAAAILALSHGQTHAILDGNVKRVLTRFHAISGWPGKQDIEQQLWQLAESHTPKQRCADYTQAIMDIGATLCTRSKPNCENCPLATHCSALAQQAVSNFPTPKPRKKLPIKKTTMLLLHDGQNNILLEKRPPTGIWGGLWSLPECEATDDNDIMDWCQQQHGFAIDVQQHDNPWRHTFSHFHLDIQPVHALAKHMGNAVMDDPRRVWYNPRHQTIGGMAAPVTRLLNQLQAESES